jgi:hypothetical protein
MTESMSLEEYRAFQSKPKKKPNKYNAKRVKIDGFWFDSTFEGKYYLNLKYRHKAGDIRLFHCQVPFLLPGGTKYHCDFLIVHLDSSLEYIDTKGRDTPMSRLKRRQVLDLYGIEIKIIKKC